MRPWTVENFGWGALPPRPPNFWLGGLDPPLNGQTGPPRSNDFFFGAVDDTGAVADTGAADDTGTKRRNAMPFF